MISEYDSFNQRIHDVKLYIRCNKDYKYLFKSNGYPDFQGDSGLVYVFEVSEPYRLFKACVNLRRSFNSLRRTLWRLFK